MAQAVACRGTSGNCSGPGGSAPVGRAATASSSSGTTGQRRWAFGTAAGPGVMDGLLTGVRRGRWESSDMVSDVGRGGKKKMGEERRGRVRDWCRGALGAGAVRIFLGRTFPDISGQPAPGPRIFP